MKWLSKSITFLPSSSEMSWRAHGVVGNNGGLRFAIAYRAG